MAHAAASRRRAQSLGEEIANSVGHGVGLLAAIVATPVLIIHAARKGGASAVVGASVFAFTVCLLYLVSALYHAIPQNRAKRVLRVLDHSAIFLLIAGTYTPFTLGVLRGAWGWSLFGVVWGLAIVGITLELLNDPRFAKFSVALYLAMGWVALVAAKPLWTLMPSAGLFWLVAGGVAYTAGVAFYAAGHLRYRHFVWHVFVLAGTACHFVAVMLYAT